MHRIRETSLFAEKHRRLETLGRLTAGVLHDLGNLLTVISGTTELLAEASDPSEQRKIASIRKAVRCATSLCRFLLEFSRGKTNRTQGSLNEVVWGLTGVLSRLLGPDINLVTSLAPGLPAIEVNSINIEQILLNLIVNAQDAMPSGGTVWITTALTQECPARVMDDHQGLFTPPSEFVMLSVRDSGTGMTDETAAHIFEPFFTSKGTGTGLGLAIISDIANCAGAAIDVHSSIGAGTTFSLYFPVATRTCGQDELQMAQAC